MLQINGFDVQFNAVKEAVPFLLKTFAQDLILLDITRQEDLDDVHDQAATDKIPVLLMTGHNSYPHKIENGFIHFINKPFTLEELLEKVDHILPQ